MPLVRYVGTVRKVDSISGSLVNWEPGQVREVTLEIGNVLTQYKDSFVYTSPGVLDSKGNVIPIPQINPYYHFHGFAGDQLAGDPAFFDKAAGNHGIFGANLSVTDAWADPGFVSTVNPVTTARDTAIRIPNLNFDYASGESYFSWWLGKARPEASAFSLVGDGTSTATGFHGTQIRVKPDGRVDIIGIGDTAKYSGSSTGIAFDGNVHSVAWAFDGFRREHCIWVDEIDSYSSSNGFTQFGGGAVIDTKTTNTFNIGQSARAPGDMDGGVVQTRALVIIRLPSSIRMPSSTWLTSVFRQLRANPGKLILASTFV